MGKIKVDQASFFMLTPLPGSMDHKNMVQAGAYMDPDYNTYDSFHESMSHPHLKNGAWTRLYRDCWRTFMRGHGAPHLQTPRTAVAAQWPALATIEMGRRPSSTNETALARTRARSVVASRPVDGGPR
jgi:hypothetical protein